ncbi:primosomal protein N [Sesbania bispinosa]|nr:primosomal protein N [Sesbania bispinosa]
MEMGTPICKKTLDQNQFLVFTHLAPFVFGLVFLRPRYSQSSQSSVAFCSSSWPPLFEAHGRFILVTFAASSDASAASLMPLPRRRCMKFGCELVGEESDGELEKSFSFKLRALGGFSSFERISNWAEPVGTGSGSKNGFQAVAKQSMWDPPATATGCWSSGADRGGGEEGRPFWRWLVWEERLTRTWPMQVTW